MTQVYLGLGANLGDRAATILEAARALGWTGRKDWANWKNWAGSGQDAGRGPCGAAPENPALLDARLSGLWESKARYVTDQPDFINAVIAGFTELSPPALLKECQRIEAALGRDRTVHVEKGPRSIDIDILLYDARIVGNAADKSAAQNKGALIIPHPLMRERKFVLLPLLELAPDLVDPVSQEPFASFLAALPRQGIYPFAYSGYDAPYP